MQLSVIIVNYNVKYFLEQCLYSVQKACAGIEAEIIVADNCSTDGSREYLEQHFKQVHFIWNSENSGFARANNQALEKATGAVILFLNPDTLLSEDSITKCLHFLATNNMAGAVGIHMVDGSGNFLKESKRAFPSPLTSLFKLSGLARLFPDSKTFARYHLGHLPENKNHEVDVLAGAFMMIPRKVLNEVGNFDERFFMYGEDVDLSYRIQKAGYKNYYFAESAIIHFKGESTKRGSLNYVRLFYKAMSLFVKKHYSGSKAGIFIFLIQTAIIIRAFFSVLGKLLQKIGLPILDACIILSSFWLTRVLWSHLIRHEVNYSPNVLFIAFPVFTALFLATAFYSGLYDKGYKQIQLVRSALIAALVLLSVYALLPESIRFSRGILVIGITLAFIWMNAVRLLFIKLQYLETSNEDEVHRQTVVVAAEKDFFVIDDLLLKAGMTGRVLGRVGEGVPEKVPILGTMDQLPDLVTKYQIKEIIFCENGLSFKAIIACIRALPGTIRNKFHASGSSSIVGSDSKNSSGVFIADSIQYNIGLPLQRRNKRLFDILVSVLFILAVPVILFIKKNVAAFYKNVFAVLAAKKTWIGYTSAAKGLPAIKNPVITSTALPNILNDLPAESLQKSDEWYAARYTVITDLKKMSKGFKYLHYEQ
jgi:GT2 family glycosyltransferase